jgi:hypothetical protein
MMICLIRSRSSPLHYPVVAGYFTGTV